MIIAYFFVPFHMSRLPGEDLRPGSRLSYGRPASQPACLAPVSMSVFLNVFSAVWPAGFERSLITLRQQSTWSALWNDPKRVKAFVELPDFRKVRLRLLWHCCQRAASDAVRKRKRKENEASQSTTSSGFNVAAAAAAPRRVASRRFTRYAIVDKPS